MFEDLPEALENAVEIARRCSLVVAFGANHLPEFPVPEGRRLDEWFAERTRAGLQRRLQGTRHGPQSNGGDGSEHWQRLESELDIICRMGYPGYFLIVADFIRWARDHRIPVGPGRGSGAGSLVAYALGITDLDPLQHDLLFERFLNPERVTAGFRHRLLHGGSRPGDRLCRRPIFPRPRRANHHLRNHGRQGGRA